MLSGKVAIVTGASSGIGAALAERLVHEGASVVLAARRKERIDRLAAALTSAGGTVLAIPADVTKRDQTERMIESTITRFGRIDILVNNAGRGHFASVEDTTDDMITSMFEVNVYSLWYTTRPVLRQMKRQRSGHIINVASMAGKIGYPLNSAYVAAKHACVGFTHALRLELIETGIHASVVCPGGVLTDWASVTEGGPMVPMFSASKPIIKQIAAERGISLPPIEGAIPAETVAAKIVECLHHPVAEVYTHQGSFEFVRLSTENLEKSEIHRIPVVLGERAVYDQLKERK